MAEENLLPACIDPHLRAAVMGDCTDTEEKAEIACILAMILALESEADAANVLKDRVRRQLLHNRCTLYALAVPTSLQPIDLGFHQP